MNRILFLALLGGLTLPGSSVTAAGPDTSSLTCPPGMKPAVYDTPREGTKPWQGKHVRCEKSSVECPRGMRPVYYDKEVYGAQPLDGRFVRCEDSLTPAGGKTE